MTQNQAATRESLSDNAQLALNTIAQRPTRGIPSWLIHPMEHSHIERLARAKPGDYVRDPERVYMAMQRNVGTCLLDQFIPDNPLSMGPRGYEHGAESATQGVEAIIRDNITIDSPEAVVQHIERFVFPQIHRDIAAFNEDQRVAQIIEGEAVAQAKLAPDILKSGYGFIHFPCFAYWTYGYQSYFEAYAIYPEIIERHFALQTEYAVLNNRAAARAYVEGRLPLIYRLDHDMADSRGLLVSVESLDRIWFPYLARCLEPLVEVGVRLLWHCDGNLMAIVPRLLEIGVSGFQGFQYEDGMDYEKICRMKCRDGRELIIIAGVSVTRTLPRGTPDDVRREMEFLVEKAPRTGLFLGGSSSITPGVPWKNMQMFVEGLRYYRRHGRK